MTFTELSSYLEKLEKTTLRNTMVEILAELFSKSEASDIDKLCYLLQGRVAPLYEATEFGVADKMMMRAIAKAAGLTNKEVLKVFKKEGDLGKAVEKIKNPLLIKTPSGGQKLKVTEVYEVLYQVAKSGGDGSQERKIKFLSDLIRGADFLSARYIVRITLGKLRLGFSDMTMLDSLSWMVNKSKSLRPQIEAAYNVRPDLGFIAATIKSQGMKGLRHVGPVCGTPILMAKAERMTNARDIIEKIGKCAVEPKYDGFRLQIHAIKSRGDKQEIKLFTRNLENVSFMYPDIVEGIKKQIKAESVILEGEAIAYNPATGEFLPFQETVQRKRKYDIEEMVKRVPLKLFAFDLLFINGKNLLPETYKKRREELTKLVSAKEDTIMLSQEKTVFEPPELERIFQEAISRGLEGVMAKRLDGTYQAGSRNFNWIKYKRSYQTKLSDTIDAVVMGYDFGQGKRTGFGIGDFLIGIYNEKKDKFETIAKIGTGLTDSEWRELRVKNQKLKVKNKPVNYEVDKAMECDVWLSPSMVVEIRADEISRSPVHTAGRVMEASKSGSAWQVKTAGFALRFPRLERFREDKKPTDATTLREVDELYKLQGGKKD